jgi:hypothetical protein
MKKIILTLAIMLMSTNAFAFTTVSVGSTQTINVASVCYVDTNGSMSNDLGSFGREDENEATNNFGISASVGVNVTLTPTTGLDTEIATAEYLDGTTGKIEATYGAGTDNAALTYTIKASVGNNLPASGVYSGTATLTCSES